MAKSGLAGRIFRICSEGDNLRTPHAPAGYAARSNYAALMMGAGILLAGLCVIPLQSRAADTNWWALGTFIQPLADARGQTEQEMQVNAPAWKAFERGKTAARAGGHKDAAASFARAVELYGPKNPLSSQAYAERAKSLRRLGRHNEALASLNALISLEPDKPNGFWARARLHLDSRNYIKALGDYDNVVNLSPNLVGAHMNRGLALYNLRRSDQAQSAFEDAIDAAKKRYLAIHAYWNSAELAKSAPGIVTTMHALLDHDRNLTLAEAHLWLGKTHFRHARFREASRAYEQAIRIAPEYEPAYKHRGWLNEKMGHISQARADYQTAASLNQGDPWILKALRRLR